MVPLYSFQNLAPSRGGVRFLTQSHYFFEILSSCQLSEDKKREPPSHAIPEEGFHEVSRIRGQM
jgi:hypothetical protein